MHARAVREGRQAKDLAAILLTACGFVEVRADVKVAGLGIELAFVALDEAGRSWAFNVCGGFTSVRSGLRRSDTLWKALGKAAVLHQGRPELPLVLLTTDVPVTGSAGAAALDVVRGAGRPVLDVIELLDDADHARLCDLARRGRAGH